MTNKHLELLINNLAHNNLLRSITVVKNLPANAGDIRDMGSIPSQNNPLEKGMATHSSILAWRMPWAEEPGEPQFIGS